MRWGDDTHINEAEVKIDSTGGLAIEHVAEELKLTERNTTCELTYIF